MSNLSQSSFVAALSVQGAPINSSAQFVANILWCLNALIQWDVQFFGIGKRLKWDNTVSLTGIWFGTGSARSSLTLSTGPSWTRCKYLSGPKVALRSVLWTAGLLVFHPIVKTACAGAQVLCTTKQSSAPPLFGWLCPVGSNVDEGEMCGDAPLFGNYLPRFGFAKWEKKGSAGVRPCTAAGFSLWKSASPLFPALQREAFFSWYWFQRVWVEIKPRGNCSKTAIKLPVRTRESRYAGSVCRCC